MSDQNMYALVLSLGLIVCGFIVVFAYFYKIKTVSFVRTKPHFAIPTAGITKMVLENGMTVLIFKNNSIPKVLVQIAYDVGSYVEGEGERGLAHLIEHMIFKGTTKMSEADIDEISRKYGASYNAFTSMDITSYYFETNKNNWKPFMAILADCMQNARFDEQHLASELKAVIQELKMYKDDYWSMMLEKVDSLVYPANHPYHYPIIGYKEDLMNLTAENLKRFYKRYYRPDRATLFVVGDIDPEEVIAQARQNFADIEFEGDPSVRHFPMIHPDLVTQHTRFYEDVKTEQLGFYWRIPGSKDKHEILSTAAALLLGGGEGSRLHRALVDEKKVASSISVYDQKFMESGIFLVLIEPSSGKRTQCKQAVQEEIAKAIEHGFTNQELEHMTRVQGKRFFMRMQNFKNFAYEWISSYFSTRDEFHFFNQVNEFVHLSSDDIQKFMKEYLDPFLINQVEVLPMPESKRAISEQAKHLSDELDKKILTKYVRTAPIEEPKYAYELAGPQSLEFVFPKPDRTVTLKNGLRVLLRSCRQLPLISVSCKFKEYFYLSSAKEGVLVDLMMNMLMEESKGYSKKDNVDFFEFYGADYYFGATGAGLSLLSTDYKPLLERFMYVMLNPTFSQDALNKIKNIAVDSFMRHKDDPTEVGMNVFKRKMYNNHPFGWSFDDAISMIKKASITDLQQLHKTYVTPNNMILALVGDFNLDEMEKVLNELFQGWPAGAEKKIVYPVSKFIPKERIDVRLVRDQVVLIMGQPSAITIHHPDLVPLKILNYIGFYSLGSRLFKLREQSGLFYTAFGALASGASHEKGFDYIGAILSPDKVDHAEKEMRVLIAELAAKGVTHDEIDAARQLYLKSLIDAVSTNASVADLFTHLEAFGLGFDYYDKVLKRVQTIDQAELNKLCVQYFTMDNMIRVRVGRLQQK